MSDGGRTSRDRVDGPCREDGEAPPPPRGRAWLIGSLAWGAFGTRRDIDLVLVDLSDGDETLLESALIRSTDRVIELLRLRDLPPAFQSRVLGDGLEIHASGD
jgi:hypothetical protein